MVIPKLFTLYVPQVLCTCLYDWTCVRSSFLTVRKNIRDAWSCIFTLHSIWTRLAQNKAEKLKGLSVRSRNITTKLGKIVQMKNGTGRGANAMGHPMAIKATSRNKYPLTTEMSAQKYKRDSRPLSITKLAWSYRSGAPYSKSCLARSQNILKRSGVGGGVGGEGVVRLTWVDSQNKLGWQLSTVSYLKDNKESTLESSTTVKQRQSVLKAPTTNTLTLVVSQPFQKKIYSWEGYKKKKKTILNYCLAQNRTRTCL